MEDFISLRDTSTLTTDPTQKYQAKVKQVLNELSDNLLTKHESFYLKSMNPKIPILYGLLKIHKINTPFRPIAFYVKAPDYKICKYLKTVLYESFHSKHSVKNSIELVNSLNKIQAKNSYKLISFDVKNRFPSIPIIELKNIIFNFLNLNIPDP